MLSSVKANLAF